MVAVERRTQDSYIYTSRQNSPCQVRSKCQPNPVRVVACVNLQFSLVIVLLFPPSVRAFRCNASSTDTGPSRDQSKGHGRLKSGWRKSDGSNYHSGDGEARLKRSSEELPFPRLRGIKIEIQIERKQPRSHFLSFLLTLDKGREDIDFHLGSGWAGAHHLSPYHLSISSPSFSFTPIASASSTRISLRSRTHQVLSLPGFINPPSPFSVFLAISVLGNRQSPTGLVIFPVSAHLARW